MNGSADKLAFDTASKPAAGNSVEFEQIAQDGGEGRYAKWLPARNEIAFSRHDGEAPLPPEEAKADPSPTGTLPQIVGSTRVEANFRNSTRLACDLSSHGRDDSCGRHSCDCKRNRAELLSNTSYDKAMTTRITLAFN